MQYALESRLQYAYDLNLLIPTRGQIGISHVIAWGAQLSLELIMVFMNSLGFYNYMDCMLRNGFKDVGRYIVDWRCITMDLKSYIVLGL
ncbi:transmembrane protein, putative [Medicago truncatula]|uniref:Transmembrane protein, putative n=1 Tax=Medicago truncatula TaxID=3880 RepID=G8A250_MEDTR|nr:transmembrane protein, putative [Medicago truncatula]